MNKQSPGRHSPAHSSAKQELEAVLLANPAIGSVDAAIADISGTLRGKRIGAADAAKLFETGMQIPLSLHLMDVRGEMMNPGGRGYSDGDPDGTAWPIAGTVMEVWGADPPRAQMLMRFCDRRRHAALLRSRATFWIGYCSAFAELDLTPVAAHELEFYLIDADRDERGRPQPPLVARRHARDRHRPCMAWTISTGIRDF